MMSSQPVVAGKKEEIKQVDFHCRLEKCSLQGSMFFCSVGIVCVGESSLGDMWMGFNAGTG